MTSNTSDDTEKETNLSLQGYLSLYNGLSGALLKEGPPSALYLGVYESVKSALLANPTFAPYPILVYLVSGAIGESVGSVVRAPAEAIKSRLQLGIDSSAFESFERVVLDEKGRETVVRAWGASLWETCPSEGSSSLSSKGLKHTSQTRQGLSLTLT